GPPTACKSGARGSWGFDADGGLRSDPVERPPTWSWPGREASSAAPVGRPAGPAAEVAVSRSSSEGVGRAVVAAAGGGVGGAPPAARRGPLRAEARPGREARRVRGVAVGGPSARGPAGAVGVVDAAAEVGDRRAVGAGDVGRRRAGGGDRPR